MKKVSAIIAIVFAVTVLFSSCSSHKLLGNGHKPDPYYKPGKGTPFCSSKF